MDVEETPVCSPRKTWQCDSVWVTTDTGAMVEKHENCREVEVVECELIKKDKTTTYPKYHCEEDPDNAITYVEPVPVKQDVQRYSRKCEAKAEPVCQTRTKKQCVNVEVEECEDHIDENRISIPVAIPYQDYDHRSKCIVEH